MRIGQFLQLKTIRRICFPILQCKFLFSLRIRIPRVPKRYLFLYIFSKFICSQVIAWQNLLCLFTFPDEHYHLCMTKSRGSFKSANSVCSFQLFKVCLTYSPDACQLNSLSDIPFTSVYLYHPTCTPLLLSINEWRWKIHQAYKAVGI